MHQLVAIRQCPCGPLSHVPPWPLVCRAMCDEKAGRNRTRPVLYVEVSAKLNASAATAEVKFSYLPSHLGFHLELLEIGFLTLRVLESARNFELAAISSVFLTDAYVCTDAMSQVAPISSSYLCFRRESGQSGEELNFFTNSLSKPAAWLVNRGYPSQVHEVSAVLVVYV